MNAPDHRRGPGGLMLGFFLGAAVTLAAGVFPARWITRRLVPQETNLWPVVVLAKDAPEGSLVTFDELMQRSVPDGTFGPEVVSPDLATHVVLRTVRVDQKAGEALRWSAFTPQDVEPSCVEMAEQALAPMKDDEDARRILGYLRDPPRTLETSKP